MSSILPPMPAKKLAPHVEKEMIHRFWNGENKRLLCAEYGIHRSTFDRYLASHKLAHAQAGKKRIAASARMLGRILVIMVVAGLLALGFYLVTMR